MNVLMEREWDFWGDWAAIKAAAHAHAAEIVPGATSDQIECTAIVPHGASGKYSSTRQMRVRVEITVRV